MSNAPIHRGGFLFDYRWALVRMLPPFQAMLVSESARGFKSGRPPLLAPSFKVQGDIAHN
jgi:hypothetical protein